MVGPIDPETDSAKLDRILAQLTTINKRLDSHDRRIARTEKFQAGDDGDDDAEADASEKEDASKERRNPGGGGGGGGGDDGGGGGGGRGPYRPRGNQHADGNWRRPREPKLSLPKYDGETDPLPWLNQCDTFFRGCRTLEEDKVWLAC